MKIALISVYNKDGIVEFAKELAALGFKILASGGTAKTLSSAGIEVTDTASLVGGAILGHRVVTLSREIHAGLLARDIKEDRDELKRLNIPWIDLVCADLYPLSEEIGKIGESEVGSMEARDAVIEKTDIGGPAMIRSAAKGRRIVVADAGDREKVIQWLKSGEPDRENFISSLAAKAEAVAADYSLASARYHGRGEYDGVIGARKFINKYGENGWQTPAGLYQRAGSDELALPKFRLMAGTEPSYNNWADVDRLLQTITHIAAGFEVNNINLSPDPSPRLGEGRTKLNIAVGVKHGNPCGAAVFNNPKIAIQNMLEGDLRAIFGGVVMVNFKVDEELAEVLLTHRMESGRRLLDGIIAPEFTTGAIEMMKRKGDKCRFLVNPALASLSQKSLDQHPRFRYVRGGFLQQPNYTFVPEIGGSAGRRVGNEKASGFEIIGDISDAQERDIVLAWAVGSTSNSNTVSLVKNGMLIGNGVGQQDRVGGCELAIKRAKDARHDAKGAVAYSDSFFPFVDGVEVLSKAGIQTIFATSGSVRDTEVKKFCEDNKITLVMLPDKDARGFFGH